MDIDKAFKILKEEFVDIVKTAFDEDEQYSIYKNPNSREIKDILKEQNGKELRIIADVDNKNVYVFSVNLLHYKAGQELYNKLGSKYGDNTILMQGIYKPKERKIKITTIMINKKLVKENREWLEKYLIFKEVNEEFFDMVKDKENSYSIYKNPNSREIKEALKENGKESGKELRVIIDLKKKIMYLFSADLLHLKASKELGIEYRDTKDMIFTTGFFVPASNRLVSLRVKSLKSDLDEEQAKWLSKFFDI